MAEEKKASEIIPIEQLLQREAIERQAINATEAAKKQALEKLKKATPAENEFISQVEALQDLIDSDKVTDINIANNPQFFCPITRELLRDPVVITQDDGHLFYFEREALLTWLESSDTNPSTGKQLTAAELKSISDASKEKIKELQDFVEISLQKYAKEDTAEHKKSVKTFEKTFVDRTLLEHLTADALDNQLERLQLCIDPSKFTPKELEEKRIKNGWLGGATLIEEELKKEVWLGNTLLLTGIANCSPEFVLMLLDHPNTAHVNVKGTMYDKAPPLLLCIAKGWAHLDTNRVSDIPLNVVAKKLLDKGADVNATDTYERTALHYACIHRDLDAINYLIEKGADKNATDKNGKKPYEYLDLTFDEAAAMLAKATGSDNPEDQYTFTLKKDKFSSPENLLLVKESARPSDSFRPHHIDEENTKEKVAQVRHTNETPIPLKTRQDIVDILNKEIARLDRTYNIFGVTSSNDPKIQIAIKRKDEIIKFRDENLNLKNPNPNITAEALEKGLNELKNKMGSTGRRILGLGTFFDKQGLFVTGKGEIDKAIKVLHENDAKLKKPSRLERWFKK